MVVVAALAPGRAGAARAAEAELYPLEPAVQVSVGGRSVSTTKIKRTRTARGQEAVADRIIVGFAYALSKAELADVQQRAARRGAGVAQPLQHIGPLSYLVDVTGAASLQAATSAFLADARVKYAGPDVIARTSETPDDSRFGDQKNMTTVQMPEAWNRTHGSAGRVIAVLDTGITETHRDLANRVIDRHDFTHWLIQLTDDVDGHGTHVAGIAAAITNNGTGVAGAGYDARLLNVKVLDDSGSGSSSMLANGIYWATDHGAHVINMSLTGDSDCTPAWYEDGFDAGVNEVRDAIDYAWSHNVVLVAAAGNNGNTNKVWPAACPHVLSVANTRTDDVLSGNSTYGAWVDVAAPGTSVLSTALMNANTWSAGAALYAKCSGTSMSSPLVAGIAALVQASCLYAYPQTVVDRIANTTDPIGGTRQIEHGRVNALKAVCYRAPTNLRIGTVGQSSIQLLWDESIPHESSIQVAYRVTGGSGNPTISLPANTENWVHTGLTAGTSYDHQVRACDANGCSGWSNTVTVVVGQPKMTVAVDGKGKVTSTPAGISCGVAANQPAASDCAEFYPAGTVVTLRAVGLQSAQAPWAFHHWEGACSGQTWTCTLTLSGSRSATAVFESLDIDI
jgi:thermitase